MLLLQLQLLSLQLLTVSLRHLQIIEQIDLFGLQVRHRLFKTCELDLGDVASTFLICQIQLDFFRALCKCFELTLQELDLVPI